METVWRFFKKIKTRVTYDPATPRLGVYMKNWKTFIGKDVCTPMFITVLFTVVKAQKQPKCPSIGKWINYFNK